MKIDHIKPADIENASMQIISSELAQMGKVIPQELAPVVLRVLSPKTRWRRAEWRSGEARGS